MTRLIPFVCLTIAFYLLAVVRLRRLERRGYQPTVPSTRHLSRLEDAGRPPQGGTGVRLPADISLVDWDRLRAQGHAQREKVGADGYTLSNRPWPHHQPDLVTEWNPACVCGHAMLAHEYAGDIEDIAYGSCDAKGCDCHRFEDAFEEFA